MHKNLARTLLRLTKPKFFKTYKLLGPNPCILDIGVANSSYAEAKLVYQSNTYVGIDIHEPSVNFGPSDFFYKANLDECANLDFLGNKLFDLIIFNHVIEHLHNGEFVFKLLCAKLKPGGYLYVEFPSIRTAENRKSKFNYHFHDDSSHVRFYNYLDLANIALSIGLKVDSCGNSSAPLKTYLSIPRAIFSFLSRRSPGSALLFIQNKIDYVLIRRPL